MEIEKILALHRQGKLNEAVREYWLHLDENPEDFQAMYLLSTAMLQISRSEYRPAATQLLERALLLYPDYFEALTNLGSCHMEAQRPQRAAELWKRALNLPNRSMREYSDMWCNLGALYVNEGHPDVGIPLLETAVKLNPGNPDAHWNLALLYLETGRFGEGFDQYSWGYKTGHQRTSREYGDNVQLWEGSPDNVVIVWGEQGIGDELLYASMIPDLCAVSKKVIFDCHPRLQKIFQLSFPNTICYGTRKDKYIEWMGNHPEATHRIGIGDMGRFFRRDLESFPKHNGYLKADPERVEHYKRKLAKLGDKPKVGISWTGGYKKTGKDFRSIPLEKWKPILTECDCTWISLQYTPEAYETIAAAEEDMDIRIYHWPSAVQNFEYMETAALVSALDLVITVNTAVHHLSGALGKECWTLTPFAHAWRYYSPSKDGSMIPWYPNTCKQYLQKQLFDWNPIISKVSRDLRARIRNGEAVCAN